MWGSQWVMGGDFNDIKIRMKRGVGIKDKKVASRLLEIS